MQIGIDSFVGSPLDPTTGIHGSDADRVRDLLEEIELADQVGLDVYGIGEHHREEFIASAPAVLLAAAAARTSQIRLASAVTVLSSDDPVRVFQDFATLDLISGGRAEIVIGRGSFIESYPLFGFDLKDYDTLFTEKLDLLLKLARQHPCPLVRQTPGTPDGPGCLPKAAAKSASHLHRCWWNSEFIRSRRHSWIAAYSRHYWRRTTPFPPVD